MITIKNLIISAIVFATTAFTYESVNLKTAYTPRDVYKYHMQGTILDKASSVELEGATIKVVHRHVELSNCPSGENGAYTLKFESTIRFTGAELEFLVVKDNYKDKRVTNIPIDPSVPKIVNFNLERSAKRFKRDLNARRWETIEYIKELERNK